jgi:hypothetical protein
MKTILTFLKINSYSRAISFERLVNTMSKQTRLQFIQKENIILVSGDSKEKMELIKIVIPVKGIVKDCCR